MLPITSLPDVFTINNIYGAGSFSDGKVYRTSQKRPYDLPTRYIHYTVRTTQAFTRNSSLPASSNAGSSETGGYMPGVNPEDITGMVQARDAVLNKVRLKIASCIHDEAMVAVNIAERQQALNAMSSRLVSLYSFSKELRKGNIAGAARALGVVPPRGLKPRSRMTYKHYANAWLEFHFGWEPLVKDIYSSIDILGDYGKPYSKPIVVRAREELRVYYRNTPICSNGYIGIDSGFLRGYVVGKASCRITVVNPNLYTANRLGLVNPAAVAWELVPFSFVVDWFVNVGDYISQFNDLLGVDVEQPCYSWYCKASGTMYSRYLWYCQEGQPEGEYFVAKEGSYFQRFVGMPEVKLGIRPFHRLSVTRAATAISLLLQQLGK